MESKYWKGIKLSPALKHRGKENLKHSKHKWKSFTSCKNARTNLCLVNSFLLRTFNRETLSGFSGIKALNRRVSMQVKASWWKVPEIFEEWFVIILKRFRCYRVDRLNFFWTAYWKKANAIFIIKPAFFLNKKNWNIHKPPNENFSALKKMSHFYLFFLRLPRAS